MELRINKMILKNFKGITNSELVFNGKNVKISGNNGSSKTTHADAFYWCFADTNTALIKNPNITPMGMPECISRVEIELELDGKSLEVAKTQCFKSKEIDGKVTTSVTNGYEINRVEKTYRDFVKDLTERGIDMENFLLFSHPAAFTNDYSKKGRETMREKLFQMCDNISDEQIAEEMTDISDLKELLKTYKLDEIEQMNKATIKHITESMGTNNALVNARIDELYSQKKDVDMAVLEEQKKNYESEIDRIDKELMDMSNSKADITEKISDLRIKKETIKNEANLQLNNDKAELQKMIRELQAIIDENSFKVEIFNKNKTGLEEKISQREAELKVQRHTYKLVLDSVLDESELSCPVCHRPYDETETERIKDEFETDKAKKLSEREAKGKAIVSDIEAYKTDVASIEKDIENLESVIRETQKMCQDAQNRLKELPESVDMTINDDYMAICAELGTLMGNLIKDDDEKRAELESQKSVARQMLNNIITSMGASEINADIDKRIEELKDRRRSSEIEKAKAEKIINQATLFRFYKNDKLSESINSHFKIAQFRLFRTLKNGTTEDACDVLIDGKEINSQANQSLQVLAKLDIINGLSEYFQNIYPVFVDDASLITENTLTRVNMENQLIWLCAADGYRELVIENV